MLWPVLLWGIACAPATSARRADSPQAPAKKAHARASTRHGAIELYRDTGRSLLAVGLHLSPRQSSATFIGQVAPLARPGSATALLADHLHCVLEQEPAVPDPCDATGAARLRELCEEGGAAISDLSYWTAGPMDAPMARHLVGSHLKAKVCAGGPETAQKLLDSACAARQNAPHPVAMDIGVEAGEPGGTSWQPLKLFFIALEGEDGVRVLPAGPGKHGEAVGWNDFERDMQRGVLIRVEPLGESEGSAVALPFGDAGQADVGIWAVTRKLAWIRVSLAD